MEKSDCHFVGLFAGCCAAVCFLYCPQILTGDEFHVSVYFHTCCLPFMSFSSISRSLMFSFCVILFLAFLSQPFLFSISIARAYLLCVQVVSVSVSVSVHDCVSFFALIAALRFIRFKAASHSFTHFNEKKENILSLGALLFTTM